MHAQFTLTQNTGEREIKERWREGLTLGGKKLSHGGSRQRLYREEDGSSGEVSRMRCSRSDDGRDEEEVRWCGVLPEMEEGYGEGRNREGNSGHQGDDVAPRVAR